MIAEDAYIAVDLGAESGRVVLGSLESGKLALTPCHRFATGGVKQNGSLRWDFGRLWAEVKEGIGRAVRQSGG